MFYHHMDPLHLLIMGVGLVLSLLASGFVRLRFNRGAKVALRSARSGAQIAQAILRHEGINDVTVHEHQGFLTDHYNPTNKTLNLSPDVFNGRSASAAGVAAHEVGHALQHARGAKSMWMRTILVYPAHFGSMLGPFLVIGGIMLAGGRALVPGSGAYMLALLGVFGFGIAVVCSLAICFNEFNASARARVSLKSLGLICEGEEEDAVRGVLLAAGLTYVASAINALMQLLYWAHKAGLLGGRSDRR